MVQLERGGSASGSPQRKADTADIVIDDLLAQAPEIAATRANDSKISCDDGKSTHFLATPDTARSIAAARAAQLRESEFTCCSSGSHIGMSIPQHLRDRSV